MKPKKIGTVTTIDAATGEVVEMKRNAMTLLPKGDVCPQCGTDHAWGQPHDRDSLTYQYQFHSTHGRWPTWTDAMQHCPPDVQAHWRAELVRVMREHGLDVPPDLLGDQPAAGR